MNTAWTAKTWMGRWHWRRMRVIVFALQAVCARPDPGLLKGLQTPAERVISQTGITSDQKLVSSTLKSVLPPSI